MITLKCHCGKKYEAREADIKRGWAKTCSKSCAAVKREFGRPNATNLDGSKVNFGKKPKRINKPKRSRAAAVAQRKRNFEYWSMRYENCECSYETYLLKVDDEFLSKEEQLDKIDANYASEIHPFSDEALGQW